MPSRAVLVKGGDARFRRHEFAAGPIGRRLDQLDDRVLGRAIVPRRQRIRLCLRVESKKEQDEERKCRAAPEGVE